MEHELTSLPRCPCSASSNPAATLLGGWQDAHSLSGLCLAMITILGQSCFFLGHTDYVGHVCSQWDTLLVCCHFWYGLVCQCLFMQVAFRFQVTACNTLLHMPAVHCIQLAAAQDWQGALVRCFLLVHPHTDIQASMHTSTFPLRMLDVCTLATRCALPSG